MPSGFKFNLLLRQSTHTLSWQEHVTKCMMSGINYCLCGAEDLMAIMKLEFMRVTVATVVFIQCGCVWIGRWDLGSQFYHFLSQLFSVSTRELVNLKDRNSHKWLKRGLKKPNKKKQKNKTKHMHTFFIYWNVTSFCSLVSKKPLITIISSLSLIHSTSVTVTRETCLCKSLVSAGWMSPHNVI